MERTLPNLVRKEKNVQSTSLRTADAFPVVAFGGGEATTGNASAVRRLTLDWPHEFCPGAPTSDFEKLELVDFVAGFLNMIKPYEATRKEVMLQLLELLMLKASSYTWKSVRGFYAHIAKQVELCRLEFNDATQIRDAATIFFKHSDLRTSTP